MVNMSTDDLEMWELDKEQSIIENGEKQDG